MELGRKFAAFLCALLLLLTPAVGGGGDGGLVNLPGGGGYKLRSTGGATPSPVLVAQHPLSTTVTMVLPVEFAGSAAVVELEGEVAVVAATNNRAFSLPSEQVRRWAGLGVRNMVITFVSPQQQLFVVYVELNAITQSSTLLVY